MAKLERVPILIAVLLFLRFSVSLGYLQCEDLTKEDCAFAVSSTGARCILEKTIPRNGEIKPDCQTSLIMAEKPEEWIESDECIKVCGLNRETYGMSTDAIQESGFTDKLCSTECQNNCPNVIDLYLKLAAGEGIYLPHLCTVVKSKSRRLIADPVQVARHVKQGVQVNMAAASGPSWDASIAASQAPVYGPAPAPPVAQISSTETLKKKKYVLVSSAEAVPPTPSPSLSAFGVDYALDFEDLYSEDDY